MKDKFYNGTRIIFNSPFKKWDGNPVERDIYSHPYSYDPYVILKIANEYEHCDYSDRLMQLDSENYNELCKKHFGNRGQVWDDIDPSKIEAFLRDYHENKDLKLIGIMKGCNVSNGFPYWIFMYNAKFED